MKRLYRRIDRDKQGDWSMLVTFEPRDLWIGVYWNRDEYGSSNWRTRRLRVYICIVPMLPIILQWQRDK